MSGEFINELYDSSIVLRYLEIKFPVSLRKLRGDGGKMTKYKRENGKLPDYEGKLPGDQFYNQIGALVRHADKTTGKPHEYHPKYGVVPISIVADRRPDASISSGFSAKAQKQREAEQAERAKAVAVTTNA